MKIAVASQNGRTISGHVGRITGFVIFNTGENKIISSEFIRLEKDQTFHSLHHQLPPALSDIDVLITGGHGAPLVRKMNAIGLKNFITTEKEPERAVTLYLEGTLPVITSEEFHNLGADTTTITITRRLAGQIAGACALGACKFVANPNATNRIFTWINQR